ncbi:hypothetical protein HC744_07895 [Arthrobacter sp. S1_S22]|nr:hypothetical protein [Arthrobacter sp. S1_S22]
MTLGDEAAEPPVHIRNLRTLRALLLLAVHLFWATVGAASAIGRWSIRKDTRVSEKEVAHP